MKEGDFYLYILIGIVSGLIVSMSNLVAICFFQGCSPLNFSIHLVILISMTFILFLVLIKTLKISKKKQKTKQQREKI